jgi:hypothetical protein
VGAVRIVLYALCEACRRRPEHRAEIEANALNEPWSFTDPAAN